LSRSIPEIERGGGGGNGAGGIRSKGRSGVGMNKVGLAHDKKLEKKFSGIAGWQKVMRGRKRG